MGKFTYYNDTKRTVGIHPATWGDGCDSDNKDKILHGEMRTFTLPEGTYPWVKMWDYGEGHGLQILVSPTKDDASDNNEPKHLGKYPIDFSFTNKETGQVILDFCNKTLETPNLDAKLYIMIIMIKDQTERHLALIK